ncbi:MULTISPECIES: hypothetical protein [unclassified Mesorhizobium]|uniref:hypothetical protein n=1 Tax=unclassified Mesorhizobium TaxID=325217 RepID=UPI0019268FFF|nr:MULTISPECIES: hypothetical protein [unclassified Mesorhizobium]BCG82918.1 hypothetical protein MesoLj113b_64600 [Mesorhizobium sp. 113-3-3]BCG90795.1 hypothetical protein MesoLj113c_69050 [Mesorhizobium sp. 113-3-9]
MQGDVTTLHISKYICAAEELGRRSGLHITMGDDFEQYVGITDRLPGKAPTYPNFRPDCSFLPPGKAFWIIGRDPEGRVAHVQAMRFDHLYNTNLAEHLRSLRACFADPKLKAVPGSSSRCHAPSAPSITGLVAYHGDIWLREDFRGRGLATFIGRIAFGLAWAKWSPDFIYALVAGWNIEKGIVDRYGYVHREPHGSILHLPAQGINDDEWLVWLTRDELLKTLRTSGSFGFGEGHLAAADSSDDGQHH